MVSGQKFLGHYQGFSKWFWNCQYPKKLRRCHGKSIPNPKTGAIKTVGLVPGFGVPALAGFSRWLAQNCNGFRIMLYARKYQHLTGVRKAKAGTPNLGAREENNLA